MLLKQWHGKQRQRATRAEKLRFQALKADDQEAYMRLVKESKNERLTTLLEETNKLLVNLGAAVQRQKDAKHSDGIEPLKDSEADSPELDLSRNESPGDTPPEEDADIIDSDRNDDSNDLLEGQRQYNSAIHSIQEKVNQKVLFFASLYFHTFSVKASGVDSYHLRFLMFVFCAINKLLLIDAKQL